jgi:CubicO group peptidase (beta-lactamase class C family)
MMTSASDLRPAFALAGEWVKDGIAPGVSIAVSRHGKLLGTFTAGKKSAGGGGPVDEETLYPVASVTKPFTATLAMRLVDQGVLTLDEPLRRLVPALGADKRELNLRDLLCHTAGLASDDANEPVLWEREAAFNEIAASAAAVPAVDAARQRVRYSNIGYWIAGAASAAALETTFSEAMRREVLEPFGLSEVFAAPDESLSDRFARRYGKTKIMNVPYGRALASPAGGLFATARDLVRFASIFLNDGVTPEGSRVLSRSAVSLMTTNQTGTLPGGIERFREWPVGSWGLGWEVKGEKSDHWTGDFTSPDTFSHPGQAGTLYWADPATGIACAILANRDLYTGWTFKPARWARLNNTIVAAVTRSS